MDKIQTNGADAQVSMVPALTTHWHTHIDEIPAKQWDELVSQSEGGSPFLRHGFFKAMADSASACPQTGWHPQFLTLQDQDGRIVAGCPAYAKDHSYGEYVFDWAWADAHDRALAAHGLHYYPKLLSAVPFSPIPGQRLLVHPDLPGTTRTVIRQHMLDLLVARCQAQGWSSAHALFLSEAETELAQDQGWMVRQGVQFHWENRPEHPYADFEDFLASLNRDKRKKIQQERRKVREAGVQFEVKQSTDITEADWDFFHVCYGQTYRERGREPYLTRAFWTLASQALPGCWTLFIARHGEQRIAAALLAVDPHTKVAYGRYWGAVADVSCLHFEACYYQPLIWCIGQGMSRFEGGAQGEHKLARGLMPVATRSVHWIQHEGLRDAVARFLNREELGLTDYIQSLAERRPFKPGDSDT
jgi:predicted N-acyltransferase